MQSDLTVSNHNNWYNPQALEQATHQIRLLGASQIADLSVSIDSPCFIRLFHHPANNVEIVFNDFSSDHCWVDVGGHSKNGQICSVSSMPAELGQNLDFPSSYTNTYVAANTPIAKMVELFDSVLLQSDRAAIPPEEYEARFEKGCEEILLHRQNTQPQS